MTPKFKVGDKVRVKDTTHVRGWCYGDKVVGEIRIILKDDFNHEGKLMWVNDNEFGINFEEDDFELVEEECEPCSIKLGEGAYERIKRMTEEMSQYQWCPPGINLGELAGHEVYVTNNKKQTIMSKITNFAKNLTLSPDEKLLRKYGLKDECGNHTDEAEELVITKLVKENEAYLIELAKGMEAEEAKK